jgi:hypothetical protein
MPPTTVMLGLVDEIEIHAVLAVLLGHIPSAPRKYSLRLDLRAVYSMKYFTSFERGP